MQLIFSLGYTALSLSEPPHPSMQMTTTKLQIPSHPFHPPSNTSERGGFGNPTVKTMVAKALCGQKARTLYRDEGDNHQFDNY